MAQPSTTFFAKKYFLVVVLVFTVSWLLGWLLFRMLDSTWVVSNVMFVGALICLFVIVAYYLFQLLAIFYEWYSNFRCFLLSAVADASMALLDAYLGGVAALWINALLAVLIAIGTVLFWLELRQVDAQMKPVLMKQTETYENKPATAPTDGQVLPAPADAPALATQAPQGTEAI